MVALSKITKKFQTTVPQAVLKALHAAPGNQLVYIIEGNTVTLQARTGQIIDLAGKFSKFGKQPERPFTLQELDEAASEAWSRVGKTKDRP